MSKQEETERMKAKAQAEETRDNPEEFIKEDWELPDPPICTECGDEGRPIVHNTGNGWHWGWECDCRALVESGLPGESHAIEWPFKADYAYVEHWQAAGFTDV